MEFLVMYLGMETKQLLEKLERSLHTPGTRQSRENLDALLAEDFLEIGASGRVYNKPATIERLVTHVGFTEIQATDFEWRELSAGIVQLTYTSTSQHNDQGLRHTIRSSIWRLTDSTWQLVFHQGTPTKTHALDGVSL